MSNYNVHLTPEVYEELMAKRRAEREMEARRKVGKVRSITDPVPESEIRKIEKTHPKTAAYIRAGGKRKEKLVGPALDELAKFHKDAIIKAWANPPQALLPKMSEKLRGTRWLGEGQHVDVANMNLALLEQAHLGERPDFRFLDDTAKPGKVSPKVVRKLAKGSRCILTSIPFDVRPYLPHSPRKPPIAGRHGDMNKTEAKFLADVLHGEGRFEPVTLKLEGGSRYTPDFMTREGDVTVFYEVKGSFRLGSEGRAHTAFYEAASQFPWCRFVWAVLRKGGKWDLKTLDPVS